MEYYAFFSWGIVVFAAAGAVYIYRPDLFQKLAASSQAQTISEKVTTTTIGSKTKKAKKQKSTQDIGSSTATSSKSHEEARTSKKRKIVAPVNDKVLITKIDGQKVKVSRDTESNVSDKEFAQQLAKAQAGTSMQPKSQPSKGSARLSVKQSQEQLSTGGHDADDDLSSTETSQAKSSSKDVSDMLEPSAAAPSTLRLTSVPSDKPKTKAKPQQFEQVTSKKKRNEQARREEQKRINAESDRLHEQKKQQQLRTARTAAGTSNQTKANNFTATAQNAWQKTTNSNQGAAPTSTSGLLDTFEPTTKTQQSVQTQPLSNIANTSVNSTNATELKARQGEDVTSAFAASARERASFSEEEQVKRIREVQQEDAWESVQSKKNKKKGRKDNSSEDSPPSTRSHSHSRASATQLNGIKTNGAAKDAVSSNRFAAVSSPGTGGFQDDEWQA